MNCDDYPFDYNKHIFLKNIITPYYRSYVEFKGMIQGVSVNRCTNCMVEGYNSVTIPYIFEAISINEAKCTLHRMGLNELLLTDLKVMPKLNEDSGDFYCEACEEEITQIEESNEAIDELKSS